MRKLGLVFAMLCLPLLVIGCKVSDENVALIDAAASSAKERAESIRLHADKIEAKNPDEAQIMAQFVAVHVKSQAELADGLAEMLKAAKDGKIDGAVKKQLQVVASNAEAEAENWRSMSARMVVDEAWSKAHGAALETQALVLAQLAQKFKP